MKILTFFLMLIMVTVSWAATPPAENIGQLKDTLTRIKKAKLTDFILEKRVISEFTETEKVYQGRAFLSGKLMRFETKSPLKSLIVYDGTTLWVVQYPDATLGGPVQVLRGQIKGKQKDNLLLSELLAKGRILESFEITKTGEDKGTYSYLALPKTKEFNLKKVILQVKDKELTLIEYVDDVGNKISLKILEQKLQADPRPELFKYKPEKGAQVTNL